MIATGPQCSCVVAFVAQNRVALLATLSRVEPNVQSDSAVGELLWRSLAASPEQVPSPEWHGRVVSEHLSKIERGEGKFLTLDEVKRRFSDNS